MNNFSKNKIDCATVKWMRHLLPSNFLSSTLTDMLIEKEKKHPFLLRLFEEDNNALKSIINQQGTLPYLNNKKKLKPELLFQKETLEKIYKMMDIFLQFDEDRSRTLEITELHTMFNTNGIPVTKDELVEIFTKKGEKKKKIWEYKLSFLDFVEFSLSNECDSKFRQLMKKIKERVSSDTYLPMTFPQSLEYIFNKGKIKSNISKISNGIKKIDTLGKRKSLYNGIQPRYSFLRKVGIGKNINVNMICKCFSNVIDISKEKLKTIEKSMSETKAVKKIKRIELPKHSRNISIKSNRNYTECSCSTYYKTQNESSNVNIKSVKPFCSHRKVLSEDMTTSSNMFMTTSNNEMSSTRRIIKPYTHRYKYIQKQIRIIGE